MKRIMRLAIVLGSTGILVLALSLGVASADHPDASNGGTDSAKAAGAGPSPVGSNISEEGRTHGFGGGPGSGIREDGAIAQPALSRAPRIKG